MNWTGRSGPPGRSTSPPAAILRGQYVKRSEGSQGPTMSPGRTVSTRPGIAASAASSHRAFRPP